MATLKASDRKLPVEVLKPPVSWQLLRTRVGRVFISTIDRHACPSHVNELCGYDSADGRYETVVYNDDDTIEEPLDQEFSNSFPAASLAHRRMVEDWR